MLFYGPLSGHTHFAVRWLMINGILHPTQWLRRREDKSLPKEENPIIY